MMSINPKHVHLADAIQASKCAEARLWGMKYRAERNPPKAATGGFPYPARTCAEWMDDCPAAIPHDPIRYDSKATKIKACAKLRDAILAMAA